ncbi:Vacuolar fusion protein MON1 homolog [Caenorhabditis elegans]|uniref:Vacuolar fusion protein MON1 homolog n=1 Tax=Caenorhabditis elegans TaxID=6239 RepID=Q9BI89_CAEEL|nr:Vacuolar fusion protein MON1 homolog [Caenorhabditis elegans]CCD71104.1 Vacuolar fusion protein MON1 homolog [Caenorhabditis elegans]|eukprot:NP_500791.2 SAND endocytosis protein family [Caenorhabditis elegans]
MEVEVPGGSEAADTGSEASYKVSQVEIEDVEENLKNADVIFEHLEQLPFQVFILSEFGKPIFVNNDRNEGEIVSLVALICAFVSRCQSWGDSLMTMTSQDNHIQFLHKSPLIFCVVSKYPEQLDQQLEVLFEQICSILSKSQLENVYKKKGDNYDLRKLLRGTDRLIDSSISSWRASPINLVDSSISAIPMNPSDREFLSTTMASCLGAAKLDGALFGIMIARRQIAAMVRFKKYMIHPRDLNIVINLVSDNTLQTDSQNWVPICLPRFNDTGFFYAYISYPWCNKEQDIPVCIVLLSVKRDHFDGLKEVRQQIVTKLENNQKFFVNFAQAMKTPNLYQISQIGSNSESLWSFLYLNHSSKQVCMSASKIPLITRDERWIARSEMRRSSSLSSLHPHLRTLFVRGTKHCLFVWVTDLFSLYCIFGPFVTATIAFQVVEKLLKSLKSHEQRYFIINSTSF